MIFSKMFPNAHILVYFLMTQPNKFGKNEQLLWNKSSAISLGMPLAMFIIIEFAQWKKTAVIIIANLL